MTEAFCGQTTRKGTPCRWSTSEGLCPWHPSRADMVTYRRMNDEIAAHRATKASRLELRGWE